MPITEFQINFTGQGINPRFGHVNTTNTLAQVQAAGYLNPYVQSQGFDVRLTDWFFVSAADGHQIYKPQIGVNGVITLVTLP